MGDRPRDDTREPAPEPHRKPGGYYYDDGTGYEIYNPSADADGEECEGGGDEESGESG